jgi:DNA-binding CsgD family transcriptional regulator
MSTAESDSQMGDCRVNVKIGPRSVIDPVDGSAGMPMKATGVMRHTADTAVPMVTAELAVLYQHVLQSGLIDVADAGAVATEIGCTTQAVTAGLQALLDLRLLRTTPSRRGLMLPTSPDVAIAELVGPMETEIRDRQQRAEAIKAELSGLHGLYFESRRARNRREAIDVIEDVDRVRATLADLARRCVVEVFSAHPGILSEQAMAGSGPHDAELLARGVRMRSIYQHPARVNPRMREFLAGLAEAGGEARTCEEIPDRIVILDREVAVIPNRSGPSGAVVVREPAVVDFLYRGLEQRWSAALPLTDGATSGVGYGGAGDDLKRAILRLLAAGAKDDHIARRLSISVRTCRRHIADLMDELQASSRFQAGALASSTGLLADGTRPGTFDVEEWEAELSS